MEKDKKKERENKKETVKDRGMLGKEEGKKELIKNCQIYA